MVYSLKFHQMYSIFYIMTNIFYILNDKQLHLIYFLQDYQANSYI